MLVLTRKSQESVVIDGYGTVSQTLTVTVLDIRGGRVKLGFDVAEGIPVHRAEVWARIQAENGAGRTTNGFAQSNGSKSFPHQRPSENGGERAVS